MLLKFSIKIFMRRRTIEITNQADVHHETLRFEKRSADVRSRVGPTLKGLYFPTRYLEPIRHEIDPGNELSIEYPQFEDVINHIKMEAMLSKKLNRPFQLTPLLLLGIPGLGKTHFIGDIADRLRLPYYQIDIANLTANFPISGGSMQWGEGEPGYISSYLARSPVANFIITLDELDKSNGGSRFDPLSPFYSLLERHTAKKFRDEAFNFQLDASHIIWIATANDVRSIPEPILSRFKVFNITQPSPEKMIGVIESIYTNRRADFGFQKLISENLLAAVKERLATCTPREVGIALYFAIKKALFNDRRDVELDDLPSESRKARRVGFY